MDWQVLSLWTGRDVRASLTVGVDLAVRASLTVWVDLAVRAVLIAKASSAPALRPDISKVPGHAPHSAEQLMGIL